MQDRICAITPATRELLRKLGYITLYNGIKCSACSNPKELCARVKGFRQSCDTLPTHLLNLPPAIQREDLLVADQQLHSLNAVLTALNPSWII